MRLYQQPHAFYAGIDLHARFLFPHVLDAMGRTVFERDLPACPDAFLDAVKPFHKGGETLRDQAADSSGGRAGSRDIRGTRVAAAVCCKLIVRPNHSFTRFRRKRVMLPLKSVGGPVGATRSLSASSRWSSSNA
jgi:hypothetical protein